jgi:dolichyl-diphosphooligosaccharide--protein glycosyltransferase
MSAMANRTVIVDNNTWNNTHIATVNFIQSLALVSSICLGHPIHQPTTDHESFIFLHLFSFYPTQPLPTPQKPKHQVGRALASTEEDAYPILESLDVDYVLVR